MFFVLFVSTWRVMDIYWRIPDELPGMQASIIRCLSQARINWGGAAEKAFGVKMGDDGGGGTGNPDGVASRWIVCASATVIFPHTHTHTRLMGLCPGLPR